MTIRVQRTSIVAGNTDPGYLQRLSKAAEMFLDGSTEVTIISLM